MDLKFPDRPIVSSLAKELISLVQSGDIRYLASHQRVHHDLTFFFGRC